MTNANNHNSDRDAHARAATGTGAAAACVLRVFGRAPVVALIEHRYDHGWIRVRLWMGSKWPRGVRWSHTPRTANEADIVRVATPREMAIGHPA